MTIEKITGETPNLREKAAEISALAGEIWREHYTSIIGAEQVEYMLEKFLSADKIHDLLHLNRMVYFTAHDDDGRAVGFCGVAPQDECMDLSKLYVRSDFRGKGVARMFMNELNTLCREWGLKEIRLTVNKNNTGAINAYLKMGFSFTDSVKTDIGGGFFMDDYVMTAKAE